jgi:hypothetical protein
MYSTCTIGSWLDVCLLLLGLFVPRGQSSFDFGFYAAITAEQVEHFEEKWKSYQRRDSIARQFGDRAQSGSKSGATRAKHMILRYDADAMQGLHWIIGKASPTPVRRAYVP